MEGAAEQVQGPSAHLSVACRFAGWCLYVPMASCCLEHRPFPLPKGLSGYPTVPHGMENGQGAHVSGVSLGEGWELVDEPHTQWNTS